MSQQTMKVNQIGGQVTFRQVSTGGFIMIAYFPGWKKAHAVHPSYPKPFGKGKEYKSIGLCFEAAKKHMANFIIQDHVSRPLAKTDYYYKMLADRPAEEGK